MSSRSWLHENASGLRHLRWAREIHATLEAHLELGRGSDEERGAWGDAAQALGVAIAATREPVKAYRDFLERVRVKTRGALRAAELGSDDDRARARAAYAAIESGRRAELKVAVRASVSDLRAAIDAILSKLEQCSGRELAENLLPPVTADRQRVCDVDDDDDDATGHEDALAD